MEDVYEQNLSQKSSLTVNDFIRVVGSDNVSYKQQVSDVKDAFGLAVYHIEYAETASTSGTRYYSPSISGAIDSIAAKGAGRYMVECIRNTSYSDSYNSITSANMTLIVDVLGASYINVIGIQLNNSTSAGDIILKRAKSPTWGNWIKMPTRAEIDALNSNVTNVTYRVVSATDIASSDASHTVTYGSAIELKLGKIVVLSFTDLRVTTEANVLAKLTISDAFPRPKNLVRTLLAQAEGGSQNLFLAIGLDGSLQSYYTKQAESGGRQYSGQLIYVTN